MKKFLCVLLSMVWLFTMTACGKDAQPKNYENTKAAALKLFDDIYAEIIDMPKQSKKEILRVVTQWQAQASGPSSPD